MRLLPSLAEPEPWLHGLVRVEFAYTPQVNLEGHALTIFYGRLNLLLTAMHACVSSVPCMLVVFGENPPEKRSIDQLRGIEGQRVRHAYSLLADRYGVKWKGRNYNVSDWEGGDTANRCLSSATACLHGLSEAAVLAAGYAPAIGFLHTGKPRSFVYDIADIWKLSTVVPEAFRIAGQIQSGSLSNSPERAVRQACRDSFRKSGLLRRIVPGIHELLEAGKLPKPTPPPEAMGPAFEEETSGDVGHRG